MIQSFCPVLVSYICLNSFKVRYYGCLLDEGEIHLVMEYMDCGSLETIIAVEKQCQNPADRMVKALIPEFVIARFAWHIL